MRERACRSCKHFEPAPLRNKGWCRNPLLYGPQQSHLVDQDTIDCVGRTGDFWEPADPSIDEAAPEGTGSPERALTGRSRLRLFEAPPQAVPPPAAGTGDVRRGAENRAPGVSGHRVTDASAGSLPRGDDVNRTGLPQGQERTVSYEPEERYWTDYLRIALPVVGLLLMLGLFWYWASAVIGDDGDEPRPSPTANVQALVTAEVPTPTPTQQVQINVEEVTPSPTTAAQQAGTSGEQPADEPTEGAEQEDDPSGEPVGQGFQVGDIVTPVETINLRADRSTDAEIIEVLEPGTELEVLREARESGTFFWIYVRDMSNDQEGYVADEFVQLVE